MYNIIYIYIPTYIYFIKYVSRLKHIIILQKLRLCEPNIVANSKSSYLIFINARNQVRFYYLLQNFQLSCLYQVIAAHMRQVFFHDKLTYLKTQLLKYQYKNCIAQLCIIKVSIFWIFCKVFLHKCYILCQAKFQKVKIKAVKTLQRSLFAKKLTDH